MLDSFVGTYDWAGLRTLKRELGSDSNRFGDRTSNEFWAIIDDDELVEIETAVLMGQRKSALELIFTRAQSLGRILAG